MNRKAKKTESRRNVTVVVADEALGEIEKLAGQLRKKGMTVDRVRPITGAISGSCTGDQVKALNDVAGVASVREEDFVTELPPADSKLQ